MPSWVKHEHLARYHFSSKFVRDKIVIDAACREGEAVLHAQISHRLLRRFFREIKLFGQNPPRVVACLNQCLKFPLLFMDNYETHQVQDFKKASVTNTGLPFVQSPQKH